MNLWHRKARDQLSSKIMQTCQEEQNSIDSWTQSMHQTVDLEKKIQVAEGHIQNDMGATKISVLNKIERLKKFMNNLNEHIDRVNRIFSAAHLIAMQDLVQNILSMRQLSLSLRSTASYEDPAFNPIKTFAIPQAEEEDDNAVASFLELKSQLHTELTTSEESLQKTQELLSEMLGIVQSLDRVRKIGVDEVDQRRAAIKEHGERIKRDIEAWKKMKQDFEGERNVLAKIRLTIETVLKTKRKNLNLSEHAAHRLFGTGEDAIESHANVVAALFGGMGGCAMIGQSVINVKSGGRGRLSTFTAGLLLIIMVVFLDEWISQIPMAALVAVMIMVSIGTFSWASVRDLRKNPLSSNIVMIATVAVVVATHNLALGVLVGVLLATLFFANKIGRFMVVKTEGDDAHRHYRVVGQVFFASSEQFIESFDFKEAVETVCIDLSQAHFWDITAVGALDKVVIKFRREGAKVDIVGMNAATETVVDKFGVHNDPKEVEKLMGGH